VRGDVAFEASVVGAGATGLEADASALATKHGEEDVLALAPDLPDLEIAAQLFLNGCLLDWEIFFPDDQGTLLTLNPYPFARTAHWIPA